MKYRAWIVNNETGEGRWYDSDVADMEGTEFWWSEGNAACDCNRALFWSRAGGEDDLEVSCGDSRFSVPYIEWENGEREAIDSETTGDSER